MTDHTRTANIEAEHMRPLQKLLNREAQRLREMKSPPKGMSYGEVLVTITACETFAATLHELQRAENL